MSTLAMPEAPPVPSLAARIKLATLPAEHAAARALRQQVFCLEQGLFDGDDTDAIDGAAITLVAWMLDGAVIGTVRIHHAGDDVWWGSRLAVARVASAPGGGRQRLDQAGRGRSPVVRLHHLPGPCAAAERGHVQPAALAGVGTRSCCMAGRTA